VVEKHTNGGVGGCDYMNRKEDRRGLGQMGFKILGVQEVEVGCCSNK